MPGDLPAHFDEVMLTHRVLGAVYGLEHQLTVRRSKVPAVHEGDDVVECEIRGSQGFARQGTPEILSLKQFSQVFDRGSFAAEDTTLTKFAVSTAPVDEPSAIGKKVDPLGPALNPRGALAMPKDLAIVNDWSQGRRIEQPNYFGRTEALPCV